jgi:hypothetical protein
MSIKVPNYNQKRERERERERERVKNSFLGSFPDMLAVNYRYKAGIEIVKVR